MNFLINVVMKNILPTFVRFVNKYCLTLVKYLIVLL